MVSTGILQSLTISDGATTAVGMVYQELVNGVNSYTVMNITYNMNLAPETTWSNASGWFSEMLICFPSSSSTGTTLYEC